MSSLPPPHRPSPGSLSSAPAPPKPSNGAPSTLGHLPRKPGSAPKRATPLVGLLANPGSPNTHGFAKQGAGFGRVGAGLEPASPVDKAKRMGNHSPLLGSPTRARRLGSFNSLATPLAAAPTRADEPPPPGTGRGPHRLRHQWVFWVLSRAPSRKMSEEEFGRAIRRLGSCDTVETFYSVYLHIKRPSAQPAITDLHVFLDPIRPVWEDPANAGGGKWTVKLRKGLADRLWETLVLSLVGGSLEKLVVGNGAQATREICGAVLSIRRDEDILAVWHRSGSSESGADGKMAKQVKLSLQTVLQLPLNCNLVYKLNADSLASGTTNGHKFSPEIVGGGSTGVMMRSRGGIGVGNVGSVGSNGNFQRNPGNGITSVGSSSSGGGGGNKKREITD